ncbi:methyltransferase [Clostridia bacterium]|nr:methyltransferase [Clostridia bacterium]
MYEETFAYVYDHLMEDVDYSAWARHYAALFGYAGITSTENGNPILVSAEGSAGNPVRVLDCACGTGNMTLALHSLGFKMTGMDRSVDMLGVAAKKIRSRGATIPFIMQDMRSLAIHKPVDAIVCACDGVNYLLTDEDVRLFFTAARNALRVGGGLFFDVSSAYKLEHILGNNCFGDDDGSTAYLWRNEYKPTDRLVTMDLTFFTRERDGRYRAARETHVQRAHEPDRLTALMIECGFKNVQAFGSMSLNPIAADDERIHFIGIRED